MNWIAGSDRDQTQLLPATLDGYVSETNPVRFLDAFVDRRKGNLARRSNAAGPSMNPHSIFHTGSLCRGNAVETEAGNIIEPLAIAATRQ